MGRDSNESYEIGRRGGSIASAKDDIAWVVGDQARRNEEASNQGIQGEEDPHAFQIITLMLVTGFPIGLFTYWGWIPWGYWVSFGIWAVVTFGLYQVLRAIPNWLSGSLMGLVLGGGAAYIGWIEADAYWSIGAGLGVGAVMFLMFYFFD